MDTDIDAFAKQIEHQGVICALSIPERYANMKIKDFFNSSCGMPPSKIRSNFL